MKKVRRIFWSFGFLHSFGIRHWVFRHCVSTLRHVPFIPSIKGGQCLPGEQCDIIDDVGDMPVAEDGVLYIASRNTLYAIGSAEAH